MSKWNPFVTAMDVPNLAEIQTRLAFVGYSERLKNVKSAKFCQYIRPPIEKYSTMEINAFDEIREVGYEYGKKYFKVQSLKKGYTLLLNRPYETIHLEDRFSGIQHATVFGLG